MERINDGRLLLDVTARCTQKKYTAGNQKEVSSQSVKDAILIRNKKLTKNYYKHLNFLNKLLNFFLLIVKKPDVIQKNELYFCNQGSNVIQNQLSKSKHRLKSFALQACVIIPMDSQESCVKNNNKRKKPNAVHSYVFIHFF
jgi:hypothetical protein